MRIGACGSGDQIEVIKEAGFDYIEMPLSGVAALPEAEFNSLVTRLTRSGLLCDACNVFFPRTLRLTGPDVNWDEVKAYVELAIKRAGALGTKVIVFGSGASRNVPQGFAMEQAWEQIVKLLELCDETARPYGIKIVIEPLHRGETNILLSGAESFQMVKAVNRPNIGLLLDIFHMYKESESPEIIPQVKKQLWHVHLAKPEGRVYPVEADDSVRPFLETLVQNGYAGRVSIEASTQDLLNDGKKVLGWLRPMLNQA